MSKTAIKSTKPLFILSPCGTSLLTNTAGHEDKKLIFAHSNASVIDEIPPAEQKKLETIIAKAEKGLNTADLDRASTLSAEINGIMAIYNRRIPPAPSMDFHLLLCTDTWLGRETGRLVEQWLKRYKFTVDVRSQKDLQTRDITAFQIALADIVTWFEKEMPSWREQYRLIFNLTGGFKSVQGFLQTLSMFYADEAVYIFEAGDSLMRIPQLPIKMSAPDVLKSHMDLFRQLHIGAAGKDKALADIPESMLMSIDGQYCLSPWGELVWERNKAQIYSEDIYPPPCGSVKLGANFLKSTQSLPPDRIRQLNEKVDDLCRFWLSRNTLNPFNPASLDFKELKGDPCPPSTHECDAWADQDAKRIFMHIENKQNGEKILVLDRLGKHL